MKKKKGTGRGGAQRAVTHPPKKREARKKPPVHKRKTSLRPSERGDERTLTGLFSGTKSGFGFVTPEEGGERDIFIPAGKTAGALDGDSVRIGYRTYRDREGSERTEGRVLEILSCGRDVLYGTVVRERERIGRYTRTVTRLCLTGAKLPVSPLIEGGLPAEEGDLVSARLCRHKTGAPTCTVTEVFGTSDQKEAILRSILSEYGITVGFSEEELAEAAAAAEETVSPEGRSDLRDLPVFTVDSAEAKDLDDAVSLSLDGEGRYLLGVHIADVSHYVKEKTALDRAAMARGTSVYFVDRVIPMLPPALSNGACSLNAGEDKYTLSALMTLSAEGDLLSVRIEPSVIRSRVRGVYTEVNDLLRRGEDSPFLEKYRELLHPLRDMQRLASLLKRKSTARGALSLDRPEASILLDAEGLPSEITVRRRGESEEMIEAFMLTANEAVAREMQRASLPCVFRHHAAPAAEKLRDLSLFLSHLDLPVTPLDKEAPTAKDLGIILQTAKKRGISEPVSYVLLRSMAKAEYSSTESGHFALALPTYCHFTSPIRRLSDLALHRILHRTLAEGGRPTAYKAYAARAAAAASEGELRALGAERRIEDFYKALYMQRNIGKVYDATVSSVTSFGIFAMLENTVEGLIPLSTLSGVFFFDEKTLTLRSRDITYRLGDKIRIRVESADLLNGKLTFSDTALSLFPSEKGGESR